MAAGSFLQMSKGAEAMASNNLSITCCGLGKNHPETIIRKWIKPLGTLQILGQTVTLQTESTRTLWCPQPTRQVLIPTVFYLLFKLTECLSHQCLLGTSLTVKPCPNQAQSWTSGGCRALWSEECREQERLKGREEQKLRSWALRFD